MLLDGPVDPITAIESYAAILQVDPKIIVRCLSIHIVRAAVVRVTNCEGPGTLVTQLLVESVVLRALVAHFMLVVVCDVEVEKVVVDVCLETGAGARPRWWIIRRWSCATSATAAS